MGHEPVRANRSCLGRLVLLAAVATGLVLAVVGVLVGPDQVRSIPAPPAPKGLLAESLSRQTGGGPREEPDAATKAGTATQALDAALARRVGEGWRPIPDMEAVPEPLRAAAWAYNEGFMKGVEGIVDIAMHPDRGREEEVREDLIRLLREDSERRRAWLKARDAWCAETGTDVGELKRLSRSQFGEWYDLAMYARLCIGVAHEDWELAAGMCWVLGGNGPVHDPVWWDREVYYWRRAGLRGRAMLAFRSIMPVIAPLFGE